MLVISRKVGQKIMLNDNIVITIADIKNGQCKIAIEADKDVKIYREEIYYQIKLENLVSKDTNTNAVDSVSKMMKQDNLTINNDLKAESLNSDTEIEDTEKKRKIIIKKQSPKMDN